MTITIKGVYRDGRIELAEKPPVSDGSEVVVTIQSQSASPGKRRGLYRGMFRDEARPFSTEDARD
ncbi:MAG TPA: hypothetical protein VER17_14975 [Tepidisphaeraceae bacterium]|nr:hypothetical protein [Tepidisphaeraceae bacterium]